MQRSLFLFQFAKVVFPLHRKKLLFCVIAFLAGRNRVPFRAFSAPRNRHYVIHCQLFCRKSPVAVIAFAFRELALPPLGASQFSGFSAFSFYIFFFEVISVRFHEIFYSLRFFFRSRLFSHFTISPFKSAQGRGSKLNAANCCSNCAKAPSV